MSPNCPSNTKKQFLHSTSSKSSGLKIPNPPPKVSCSSDYGLFRSPVACHSTMSPDCGCGIDQDDRADINPKPGVGSDSIALAQALAWKSLSGLSSFSHPCHFGQYCSPLQRPFTLIKPRLQSLLGSQATHQKNDDSSQALQKLPDRSITRAGRLIRENRIAFIPCKSTFSPEPVPSSLDSGSTPAP